MGGKNSGRYRPTKQVLPKRWTPRWLTRLDGRSPVAIAIKTHLVELHEHLGGDPSPVEARLCQRLAHVDFFATQHEARAITNTSGFDEAGYLALVDRHLRLSQALGLQRRAKPALRLREYIQQAAARAESAQEPRTTSAEASAAALASDAQEASCDE